MKHMYGQIYYLSDISQNKYIEIKEEILSHTKMVSFSLVSPFNDISRFVGYSMSKPTVMINFTSKMFNNNSPDYGTLL